MFASSPDQLKHAVETQLGGKATFVQSVPVHESLNWQTRRKRRWQNDRLVLDAAAIGGVG
jgi:hypothetical protein